MPDNVQPADKETVTSLHDVAHQIVVSELAVTKDEYCPADPVEIGVLSGMQMALQHPEWAVGFLQSLEVWPPDEESRLAITKLVTDLAVSGVTDG